MARSLRNLRPWKKGTSGNPGGRPKKPLLDEILTELLEDRDGADARTIAKALVKRAKRGDLRAYQLIAERTQGRPKQKVDFDFTVQTTLGERMRRAEERMKEREKKA